jgi:RHS repeat-associated protein
MYDSNIWTHAFTSSWQPTNVSVSSGTANSWGGWRLVTSGDPGYVSFGVSSCCRCLRDQTTGTQWTNWTWTAPDGTAHTFPVLTYQYTTGQCTHETFPNSAGVAYDASGYYMSVTNYSTAVVHAPDGTQVYPSHEDSNGNSYSFSGGNFVDTLGRNPVTTTTNGNTITYSVPNSTGGTSTYTITTESIPVSTFFQQANVTEYSGNITVIESIQLPDSTSYSFTYDTGNQNNINFGFLRSMTLSTGGTISYYFNPARDAFGNAYESILSRTTPDGSWSYSSNVSSSCSTGQVNCQQTFQVTKPSGDKTMYTFTLNGGSWQSRIDAYTGSISPSNLQSTTSECWNFVTVSNGQCTYSVTTASPATQITKAAVNTILPVPGSSISKTVEYTWDTNNYGNVTQVFEWKFGSSPSNPADRTTTIGYLNGPSYISANILNRPASVTVTGASGTVAQTNYSYDGSALASGAVGSCPAVTGSENHDDANYGTGNTTRGNVTQLQRLVSGTSNYISSSMTYDITGQSRTSTDPNGNTTSYCYADNLYNDPGDGQTPTGHSVSKPTNAYLTTITFPTVNSISLTNTFGYYWGTGQQALSTDANGNTSYSHFSDVLNRPTSTALPNSEWTRFTYSQTDTQLDGYIGTTNSTASTSCTVCNHSQTKLDGLGRVESNRIVNDPDGETYIDTTHDSNGRIASVSNPYRSVQNGVETPSYDGLDRETQVKHADNNITYTYYGANVGAGGGATTQLCSVSTYGVGYPILSVDEAGKKRQTWTDGFGRVIETDEPGSGGSLTVGTCYSYDLNNNLTLVTSLGLTQTPKPAYAYDLISRVTSKTIPGLGAKYFSYTTSGGSLCSGDPTAVCQRTDARNITTNYGYDALNRLVAKTYSDNSTLPTYYYYDQSAPWGYPLSNYKGRLTTMGTLALNGSVWVTASSFDYDVMGHVTWEEKLINQSVGVLIYYSYNLDGSIASITYPGGRIVNYADGNAQRMTKAADSTNGINYVTAPSSGAMYAPQGAVANVLHGFVSGGFGGITESYTYNNRLEVTGIQATSSAGTPLNLAYSYVSGNNGNISQQTNSVTSGRTQNYTYDTLNRLLTAQTVATSGGDCWGQSFGNNGPPPTLAADALANLFYASSIQCSSPAPQFTMNTSNNNQFTGTGIGYDVDGDMIADTAYSYTYDAENRISTASGMTNGPYCYTYDAFGVRSMKAHASGGSCAGTVTVDLLYWRSLSGDTIAETDGTASTTNSNYNEYIFFAGRRIAQSNPSSGNVYYYFADHLRSTRVVTTATGAACYEVDYLPYGAENTPSGFSNTCSTRYRFTGYERDLETAYGTSAGNVYAFARYYNSRLGRFMSGDPLDGDITDPQTLNHYAYARNNPVNLVDPAGLSPYAIKAPNSFDCGMDCGFGWSALDFLITGEGFVGGENGDVADWFPGYFNGAFVSLLGTGGGTIYGPAVNLAARVLSGKNDCAEFFNSSVLFNSQDTAANAANALASDNFGTESFADPQSGLPTPNVGAKTFQFQGFGSTITVNSDPSGLFLATNHWILGGIFPSGQLAGQTTQILHELAHTVGLIPGDANGGSEANTATILAKCAIAILAAINGVNSSQ